MGRFRRRANLARELTELKVAVIELRDRLTVEQQSSTALQFRLEELERRNHELAVRFTRDQAALASSGASGIRPLAAPTPTVPTPPPPPTDVSLGHIAEVAASASDLAGRTEYAIEELRTSLQRITGRLDELTFGMQTRLNDLGFEIERAAMSSRASAAVSDLALDRQLDLLRDSQIRLASEQSRYEIALRAELADIADGLRRYVSVKGGRRDHVNGNGAWPAPEDDLSRS